MSCVDVEQLVAKCDEKIEEVCKIDSVSERLGMMKILYEEMKDVLVEIEAAISCLSYAEVAGTKEYKCHKE